MSSEKPAIYPNSFILEREGEREREGSVFLRKKGRMRNLPIGAARLICRGGSGGGSLILWMKPWLGFRRGVGGHCAGMNE
jgi:hypothetical protein